VKEEFPRQQAAAARKDHQPDPESDHPGLVLFRLGLDLNLILGLCQSHRQLLSPKTCQIL
jgi:hypothetical protein